VGSLSPHTLSADELPTYGEVSGFSFHLCYVS